MATRERLEKFAKRKRKHSPEPALNDSSIWNEDELVNNNENDENFENENLEVVAAEEIIEDTVEIITFSLGLTQRENISIWDENDYNYQKNRDNIYYCPMYRKHKCKAKVRVNEILEEEKKATGYFDKAEDAKHNHLGDDAEKDAQARRFEIKQNLRKNPGLKPRKLISRGRVHVADETFVSMGDDNALRQMIRREKAKLVGNIDSANVLAIQFKEEILMKNEKSILLYDSRTVRKGEKDVVLVFAHPETLAILREANHWHVDGTFKSAPKIWSQVFVVGASCNSRMVICAQALLPGKSQRYYSEVFAVLKKAIAPKMPTRVLTDFEKAEILAIQENFAMAIITLCYFHFCQSMLRHFSELHLPKKFTDKAPWNHPLFERANIPVSNIGRGVKRAFRSILALPLLPPHIVRRAFTLIMRTAPGGLEEFLFYVCKTYIGLTDDEKKLDPKIAFNGLA